VVILVASAGSSNSSSAVATSSPTSVTATTSSDTQVGNSVPIKVPDLRGTWRGELKSDWIDPKTGQSIAPVPVILVIRQSFSDINITLMTKESTSYSTTTSINATANGEDLYLTYNYTNRPKASLWDRSAIHDGAAILKIIKRPNRRLEGEYWTGRKTRGDLSLQFDSNVLAESFF